MVALWEFDAIGTRWGITTDEPLAAQFRDGVTELINAFDAEWSRFRPDSLVSILASGTETAPAPADAAEMLNLYVQLSNATKGAVNPLIGGALSRRGYAADGIRADKGATVTPAGWQDQLRWGDGHLTLSRPATIDVGALGKGRLVDLVMGYLAPLVEGDVTVDGSGDLAVRGAMQTVGLEHPYDSSRVIGVWQLANQALCASATNRRAWGDGLHHVLDARTGEPVRTIAATWAVAPTAMHADAISTALFFDGGAELAYHWGVQWVRMTTDGRVEWSPDSKAELFL